MSAAIPFDTHAFVKQLQSAGFTVDQAEVITDIQRQSNVATLEQARHDYHLDELATKRDLGEVALKLEVRVRDSELKLEAGIREVELKLEARIAETKADLTRWIIGAGVLQTSLIIAALMKAAHFV